MNTFAIHTLGCKVNLFESNSIRNDLLSNGLIEVPFDSRADVYIINTCSVTNKADSKSKFFIRKAYKNNNDAIIVVAGCMSQVNKDLMNELNISIQIGNKYKNNIFDLLQNYKKNKQRIQKIENILLEKEFESNNDFVFLEHTRAFIKIQDGCNFMCSYCIIPFTRGKQRSASLTDIVKQIENLVKNNFKEIVLTGVNTAGYLDKENNTFFDLLKAINDIKGTFRVRISSVEPFQITDEIVDLITSNKNRFCQHWHICLQSGSNEVLKHMNRKYSVQEFENLVNKIKNKSPFTNFTTDYIVGFPLETDEDQKSSIDFLEKISFFDMHIFPFSKRKNTRANLLKDVDEKIKKERFKEVEAICLKNKRINLKKFLNTEVEVLFEKKSENEKYYSGYSSEYCKVYVESNENIENKLLKVKIVKVMFDSLFGEIV